MHITGQEKNRKRKKAVMYGAGSIGRGFIAQLFYDSGYDTAFIDVNTELIDQINEKSCYPICFVSSDSSRDYMIECVSGIYGQDETAVTDAVASADILATSVGKKVLPQIAGYIAAGIRKRMRDGNTQFLNILVCENMIKANVYLRGLICQHMNEEEIRWMDTYIGTVETTIGRNVPVMTPDLYGDNPLRVLAEEYTVLPIEAASVKGPMIDLKYILPEDNFDLHIREKLFMYNMAHAVIGYTTAMQGVERLCDAVRIPEVRYLALEVLTEISLAMSRKYGKDLGELILYSRELLFRFGNKKLGISVPRLCQELKRKVSFDDRLVGPARLCVEQGISPKYICVGIAAAFRYVSEKEPDSLEISAYIAENGIGKAIEKYSGITQENPIAKQVCSFYAMFAQGSDIGAVLDRAGYGTDLFSAERTERI